MKQRAELIQEILKKQKLTPVEETSRKSIKDIPLRTVKCLACGRFIDYTEPANIIFRCPVCKEGVITRCKKCRRIGRVAECPVCGAEYP